MVYFVSAHETYTFPVYAKFLDVPPDSGFDGVTYEADPETLDLQVDEREFLAKGRTAIQHGYRVNGDKAPKKLLWPGGKKKLPEFIMCNCSAVSPRFRDLVEQFELGVHQFFPVDIYKTRDAEPVATYYWLNVCNRIDSIHTEASNLFWKPNYEGERGVWRNIEGKERKHVFSLKRIGGKHMWYDPYVPPPNGYYVSNQFAAAAKAENFSGLTLTEREEA